MVSHSQVRLRIVFGGMINQMGAAIAIESFPGDFKHKSVASNWMLFRPGRKVSPPPKTAYTKSSFPKVPIMGETHP